jgi:hypothetical protein
MLPSRWRCHFPDDGRIPATIGDYSGLQAASISAGVTRDRWRPCWL